MATDFAPLATLRPAVMGTKYIVASGHYLASMAGIRILESGGNVVDAGVATGLCINVLQPDLTNIGGVAPIILYLSRTEEVVTISGLGRWSRKATHGELQERGGDLSGGALTSIVPSALDAWIQALDRYGTMSLADVAAPAAELAEGGFPVNHFLHANLSRAAERLENWPSSRQVFLSRGRAPEVGERLIQPALGRTLRRLVEAERGASGRHEGLQAARDVFYKGDMARAMVRFCQQIGGILTDEDLATFRAQVEKPVVIPYRDYDVYACGPWCQGPVVLQALNILEGYDLASLPHNSARVLHLIVEALKAAFADRHAYYGDPEFISVPIEGLLSKEYAGTWRRRLQNDHAWPTMPEAGNPWAYQKVQGRKTSREVLAPSPGADYPDTSYLCVMDADGNSFSATPSDPATGVPLVPELGCIVSPRGHQSWLDPAHPSCVAPSKRPRLTPSPGLVMKGGQAFMPYGTPGLDVQPQAMVQLLVNIFDYGMDVQSAIEAPRVATYSFPGSTHPHPYDPGRVRAEARISSSVLDELTRIGHRVEPWPEWTPKAGALCAIVANHRERTLAGGADPRRLAYAIGW